MNLKQIKDLNIWAKTIKLLGENTGLGNDFLDMTPKAQATKEKNKLDYTKIENFCASKDTNQQSKKAAYRMGENILKLYILYIYIKNSYNSREKSSMKKWAKD